LNKRLARAYIAPCFISIAALALGGVVGLSARSDAVEPPAVLAESAIDRATVTATDQLHATPTSEVSPTATATAKQRVDPRPPEQPTPVADLSAPAPPANAEAAPADPPAPEQTSLFEHNQLIVYYGTPLAPGLGVLGLHPPQEMAQRLKDHTRLYDDLNGDRNAVPVMDLIYGVVQSEPTKNGLYLSYLSDERVNEYIRLAEEHDMQLILDLQIGRSTVTAEVEKIERFLMHPRVHVAVDPEYAVGPNGYPIHTPGRISGHDINAAQLYLHELAAKHNLPPKMLVIHQFMDGTIVEGEVTVELPNVDLVLNMDAFGDYPEKVKKYRHYATRPYAQHRSFNIFLKQDKPVGSEEDVLALDPMPDMVMYQ
jgi:hypothetical protein